MSNSDKYLDFFDIDKDYYAVVTGDLFRQGKVSWKKFYPHKTFVEILDLTHRAISGSLHKSIWIDGTYGTGKSYASLTVKALFEAAPEEVDEYFRDYQKTVPNLSDDLRRKIIADQKNLVVVHTEGSSDLTSDARLVLKIQLKLSEELKRRGYKTPMFGIRETFLKWISDDINRRYFDDLISSPEFRGDFSGKNAGEVVDVLERGSSDVSERLLRSINMLAEKKNISALWSDVDKTVEWIRDVISENGISVLFIWDEFTEYFQKNSDRLTGFQKLAELSSSCQFYFMIIAHRLDERTGFGMGGDSKKLMDRFSPVTIELPENMAFMLMAQAMRKTSDPERLREWAGYVDQWCRDLEKVNRVISGKFSISESNLNGILPFHPYAVLVLKFISAAFVSNQRSMFDFLINDDDKFKGFKWFIKNHEPLDDTALLSVDMLWDYLQSRGDRGFSDDVRAVFSAYSERSGDKMGEKERKVFKTVLIFQALSKVNFDVELLKASEDNLELVFSGCGWSEGEAKSIAEILCKNNKLTKDIIKGKCYYRAYLVESIGDLEPWLKKARETAATRYLITNGKLFDESKVPVSLKKRLGFETASCNDFSQSLNKLKKNAAPFRVLVVFSRNDEERRKNSAAIREKVSEGDVIFAHALTTFDDDGYEDYVRNLAYNMMSAGSDKGRALDYLNLANKRLEEWKSAILRGDIRLYSSEEPEGLNCYGRDDFFKEIKRLDCVEFKCGLEHFAFIDNMYNLTALGQGAECGISQNISGTFKSKGETSIENQFRGVWRNPNDYWKDEMLQDHPLVKMKKEVEEVVERGFARDGKVSIADIYSALAERPFGIFPCNISSLVLGFLLKEYVDSGFYWSDGKFNDSMGVDRMKSMISNYLKAVDTNDLKYRHNYIVKISPEITAFLEGTAHIFDIAGGYCSSVESARDAFRAKACRFSFPIWALKGLISKSRTRSKQIDLFSVIDNYCLIANSGKVDDSESGYASKIGGIFNNDKSIVDELKGFANDKNIVEGMKIHISKEHWELPDLAGKIGAGDYLEDLRRKFPKDANWVWKQDTADEKIRELILDYKIISESSNYIQKTASLRECLDGWRSRLDSFRFPSEVIEEYRPGFGERFSELFRAIKDSPKGSAVATVNFKNEFLDLVKAQGRAFKDFCDDGGFDLFKDVCSGILSNISDEEARKIFDSLPCSVEMSKQDYMNAVEEEVGKIVETARKNMLLERWKELKDRLLKLWKEKTGTESPVEWSEKYGMPVKCMFVGNAKEKAFKVLDLFEEKSPNEELEEAVEWLESEDLSLLGDEEERNRRFIDAFLGKDNECVLPVEEAKREIAKKTKKRPFDWLDDRIEIGKFIEMTTEQSFRLNYVDEFVEKFFYEFYDMSRDEQKKYLERLFKEKPKVGIGILADMKRKESKEAERKRK